MVMDNSLMVTDLLIHAFSLLKKGSSACVMVLDILVYMLMTPCIA